jgi:hypothetical protein
MSLWTFLAFAGGDDEEGIPIEDADGDTTTTEAEAEHEDRTSTTRRRRPPTTTTTAVLPGAPLLGEPTGLSLALVGSSGRVVDLDTGGVIRVGVPVVGVTAGGLLVNEAFGLALWPAPFDGSGSTTILPSGRASQVEQLWVVADGTLVWAMERPEGDGFFESGFAITLIDLEGVELGRVEVPPEVWPAGATDDGVVLTGPGGAYLLDEGGRVERFTTGDPFSVAGDRIYVVNCDEGLRCQVEVFDGRGRLVDELPPTSGPNFSASASADGRLAQITFGGESGEPNTVTVDGVTVFEQEGWLPGAGGPDGLAWSPDGRWLAIAAQDGIHVIDTFGDGVAWVVDPGFVDEAASVYFVPPAG